MNGACVPSKYMCTNTQRTINCVTSFQEGFFLRVIEFVRKLKSFLINFVWKSNCRVLGNMLETLGDGVKKVFTDVF